MKKCDWADKKVHNVLRSLSTTNHKPWPEPMAQLLRLERARARRVVREYRKQFSKDYIGNDIVIYVCDALLRGLR